MGAALKVFGIFAFITGVMYPMIITGLVQIFFPYQANGSLIYQNDKVIGSHLIAQPFSTYAYFWSRPSASNYKSLPSAASQLAPTSQALMDQIKIRQDHLHDEAIAQEMLFYSASGLDPHVSLSAVKAQIPRVAEARSLSPQEIKMLQKMIDDLTETKTLGILGQTRINILALNLKMDKLLPKH